MRSKWACLVVLIVACSFSLWQLYVCCLPHTTPRKPNTTHDNVTRLLETQDQKEGDRAKRLFQASQRLFTSSLRPYNEDVDCHPIRPDLADSTFPQFLWECPATGIEATITSTLHGVTIWCPQGEGGEFNTVPRDYYSLREGGGPKKMRPPERWQNFSSSPHNISMASSGYLHARCVSVGGGGPPLAHHGSYHLPFMKNETIVQEAQKIRREQHRDHRRGLDLQIIICDSLSHTTAMRPHSLPRTVSLLRRHFFNVNRSLSHQAFVFNRLHSEGFISIINQTPLYSGHVYTQKKPSHVDKHALFVEWLWTWAKKRGYITHYGDDWSNGFMSLRYHNQKWDYRMPCGPTPSEKEKFRRLSPKGRAAGVQTLVGLCMGTHLRYEYWLNYTTQFWEQHIEYGDSIGRLSILHLMEQHHTPPRTAISQVDSGLSRFLEMMMSPRYANTALLVLGDHGRPFFDAASFSAVDRSIPAFLLVLPTWFLLEEPRLFEDNLFLNQERLVAMTDVHLTMKQLMTTRGEKVEGYTNPLALSLLTHVLPTNRTCTDVNITSTACVCHAAWVSYTASAVLVRAIAEEGVRHVNAFHQDLRDPPSPCLSVELDRIDRAQHRIHTSLYRVSFSVRTQTTITAQFEVLATYEDSRASISLVSQQTRYREMEACMDPRVPPHVCLCV